MAMISKGPVPDVGGHDMQAQTSGIPSFYSSEFDDFI